MLRCGRFARPTVVGTVLTSMLTTLLATSLATMVAPGEARAQGDTARPRTWFSYASLGLVVGGAGGLATSYLLDRDGRGFDRRPRLYGAGVGALSGLALGLTLGIVDHVGERDDGFGVLVAGTLLAACGALLGGVENLSYDFLSKVPFGGGEPVDPSAFPVGAAWGALIGMGGAVVLAVINVSLPEETRRGPFMAFTLGTAAGAGGRRLWVPTLLGQF